MIAGITRRSGFTSAVRRGLRITTRVVLARFGSALASLTRDSGGSSSSGRPSSESDGQDDDKEIGWYVNSQVLVVMVQQANDVFRRDTE